MGTFSDKNILKLVYFIVKISCFNSQIKDFFKERRPRMSAASEVLKFKERRDARTSKYGNGNYFIILAQISQ
jgi:hypothetical protein